MIETNFMYLNSLFKSTYNKKIDLFITIHLKIKTIKPYDLENLR